MAKTGALTRVGSSTVVPYILLDVIARKETPNPSFLLAGHACPQGTSMRVSPVVRVRILKVDWNCQHHKQLRQAGLSTICESKVTILSLHRRVFLGYAYPFRTRLELCPEDMYFLEGD